jgi:hypothetical protein
MKARQEFIDAWKHEWAGMVLDALTAQRTGADLGLFARHLIRKVDERIGKMWDDLQATNGQPKPAANGAARPVAGKVGT